MKGFVFFTHFCDCSVKTELIYRSNCAKNSCNRVLVGTIVDRQFSTAFFPWADLWTMDSWHGRLDVRFRQILTSSSLPFCPIHTCGLSALTEYHFFSEPGPRNDHCPVPNLFAYRETSRAFDSHSFSLSIDHHEMSLNIDMKIILPVKFSGVSSNLNSNSWTSWLSCNVLNPGKIFHSNSIGWPSILSKVLYSWDVLNHSNLVPMHRLIGGYRVSYQDTIQNLKIRRPLCAEDWWLVHHQSKTNTSMNNFPNQLIVFTP